jgi:heme-degrading monooxygenase HmoA
MPRREGGSQGAHVLRNPNNPNDVTVLMKWDTMDKAQEFAHSPGLREAMQNAGVMGKPDIYFLEDVEETDV